MNPQFWLKLGQLIGSLDDFLIRVRLQEVANADIDRIEGLVKDVKKKFYADPTEDEVKNERV